MTVIYYSMMEISSWPKFVKIPAALETRRGINKGMPVEVDLVKCDLQP
jgi:hypothetical protein